MLETRRRARRAAASARSGRRARRAGAAGGRARRARGAPRLGVRRPRRRATTLDARRCRGPTPRPGWTAWRRARWPRPAVRARRATAWSTSTATGGEETQVADDLVARAGRPAPSRRRGPARARRWRASSPSGYAEQRAAAAAAAAPLDHGAHRRSGHRQDHDRRRAAGAAGRAGRRGAGEAAARIALAAPTGKAAARLQEAVAARDSRVAAPPTTATGSADADRGDAAPAARLAARQPHPVPPRPRQPAAARRGRRRRDLDGRR